MSERGGSEHVPSEGERRGVRERGGVKQEMKQESEST